jgi:hypothetical protein
MRRRDFLYELRPRPAVEVLLDEAAKAVAEDLEGWPPRVEVDPAYFGEALLGPRPHRLVFREAFLLARLDLLHDYEAIDRWEREEQWKNAALTTNEKEAAVFLWRYLAERAFDLSEALESRLSRGQLVSLLDRIEKRL